MKACLLISHKNFREILHLLQNNKKPFSKTQKKQIQSSNFIKLELGIDLKFTVHNCNLEVTQNF